MFLLCFLFLCVFSVDAQSTGLGFSGMGGEATESNAVTYTVVVSNESNHAIDVYLFSSPAKFDKRAGQFTNSLGTQSVQPGTSQARFTITYSYFAAAQKFDQPVGEVQSTSVSLVPIAIETDGQLGQRTNVMFDKNSEPYLTTPGVPMGGPTGAAGVVVDGSFQIQTPSYPSGQGNYGIGLGVISAGQFQLATYTMARPGITTNVQPVVKFFVSEGETEAGRDVNFFSVSTTSALCDATSGTTVFMVTRTNDGRWKVNGQLQ